MDSLLPKLAALLTDEYKLHRSLRGQIMFLKAELETMQLALERVSEAPVMEKQVRIWARDVRELSYDIEDSIALSLLTTANLRHKIATDITGIMALVSELASRRDR
nr:unnamed protein product [Digitaria exilis]